MTSLTDAEKNHFAKESSLLRRINQRIRRSLELEDILSTTATEVRAFLGSDRVKIYQFHSDKSGKVVAESIHNNRLPSLMGLSFPADDIPAQARQLFVDIQARVVVDVASRQIGQSFYRNLETGEQIAEEVRYRPIEPCHAEYLTAMGVKSSLTLPILYQDQLWGLLVAHHAEPQEIAMHDLQAVQGVVDQISVAIAQSMLLAQARDRAEREAQLNHITNLLHSRSTIEIQAALETAVTTFGGSGGRVCIKSEAFSEQGGLPLSFENCTEANNCVLQLYLDGTQPTMPELAMYPLMEQYSVWQEYFQAHKFQPWAISDIYNTPQLRNLQPAFRSTKIRGMLVVPLQYRQRTLGYLSIFRDELATETLWAGQFDPDQRQLYPRQSFELWRDTRKAQVCEWTAQEIKLGRTLGIHFATAIQQSETHQQLQILNDNLEHLNAGLEQKIFEQTSALWQTHELQQILFQVVVKMRDSLDLDTIFKTTAQELRRSLKVERVGIFRFTPGSSCDEGEFVSEDCLPNVSSNLGKKVCDRHFQKEYAPSYYKGGRQVLNDVRNSGLKECHIALLESLGIKAQIVIPLVRQEELWGLLCVHQCAQPRQWERSEIQFVTQIAAQLDVAIQQAELLAQTQEQSHQLAETLANLQETQLQLVQTEKMSSLGHLVAGIAHEINNPINFIHGNVHHISRYIEDILELLDLYQKHYADPLAEIDNREQELDLDFLRADFPKILTSMKIGTERIRQIVLSLRNFSRLDQADMKQVDLHEGIDSTLLILQHRFKAQSIDEIELIKEYGNLPLVECYAGQVNQVLMNLLSNAIDALEESTDFLSLDAEIESSPEGTTKRPTIHIRTEVLENQQVAIRIADNGMGIPEKARNNLFDPFFTTKPIGKGTGLGLSISYQIITDKHRGSLKYFSDPGKGTEFVIQLPIQKS
ncbi:MAG: GAF domain-containing protein [Leptolyngbyaceae cyanobacterium CSU_1_4]|nr:GAF domain-containing protein [Leptolyngbyaceae cyanobacterium CSU_1_4]